MQTAHKRRYGIVGNLNKWVGQCKAVQSSGKRAHIALTVHRLWENNSLPPKPMPPPENALGELKRLQTAIDQHLYNLSQRKKIKMA